MDLWGALRVLARRWLVVVPLLILTAFGAFNLYSTTTPEYTVSGTLLMRGPSIGQDEDSGLRNPYLDYGNLAVPARVVIDVTLTPTAYAELTRDTQTTFELGLDTTTSAPLVTLTVFGPSPDAVVASAQTIVDFFNATLLQRQLDAGAPEDTLITTEIVAPPVDVLEQNSSRVRLVVGVFGVGVLVSVGMAFLVEAVVRVRARGNAAEPPAEAGEPAETARPVSPPPPSLEAKSGDNLFRDPDDRARLELPLRTPRRPAADTQSGPAEGNGHDGGVGTGKRARRTPADDA